MTLLEILGLGVITAAAAIAALPEPPPHPHSLLLSRMERLESLIADHQAQFQQERHQWKKEKQTFQQERHQWEKEKQTFQQERHQWEKEKQTFQQERHQWEKEKQILAENLRLLQGDVHALHREKQEMGREMETLQNTPRTLTQTSAAENYQGLKSHLGDLQRRLDSMDSRQQQSPQDPVIRREANARPDTARDEREGEEGESTPGEGEEDESTPGEQSAQSDHTIVQHQRDPQQGRDSKTPYLKDSSLIQQISDPDPSKQHVRVARSDDQGPMEVIVQHLAQQTSQLTTDVQALRATDARHEHDIQAARASTFVHWGSSTCGGSAQLVYSGMVGGSFYDHPGAAATALCLSLSPTLLDMSPTWYTVLYGGEYEMSDSHHDLDPVCAVCRSSYPTTIMVPGTNVCSAGWTLQYSGFLMAGDETHKAATEFLCVDSKLESALGTKDNHNGYLLYYTKAVCGSLPCPPYEGGKVVTCAVCSK